MVAHCQSGMRGTRTSALIRKINVAFMTLACSLYFLAVLAVGTPLRVQGTLATSVNFQVPDVGLDTNLPLPRYVSLKAKEANVRRGPSLTSRMN